MNQDRSIARASAEFYAVPTDFPEADGTFEWTSTSMVLIQLQCGGHRGIGYTYADRGAHALASELLERIVLQSDVFDHAATWEKMLRQIRNSGETGAATMAVSAIDCALWDLAARLLDIPLVQMLGQMRSCAPVYGSGGFTTYSDEQLRAQLGGWAEQGFDRVKMKIGTHPQQDPERVRVAREAIGPDCELFVDANGVPTPSRSRWRWPIGSPSRVWSGSRSR